MLTRNAHGVVYLIFVTLRDCIFEQKILQLSIYIQIIRIRLMDSCGMISYWEKKCVRL